jgi:hypothetical protein
MPRVSASVVEPALRTSADPLAVDLLARLRTKERSTIRAKATRPFNRTEAMRIYRRKATLGDRPTIRTDGYAPLLAALAKAPETLLIVHGLRFEDAVYLVFTDPARTRCMGVLRKVRLAPGP